MRTRTPLPIAFAALLLVASGVRMAAQQPPAPPPTDPSLADRPAVPDAIRAPGDATRGQSDLGQDTLSVDFPDADIREILRNVADLFELNIAMPDSLQGQATIKLRDVTWRQIFQTVLAPVNYTYIEDGNIIKIVSNDSLLQEPVSTEVFLINYANATDILPTINSLVDPAAGGKIVVDTRSNALVITERPSRMNRIRPIIEVLDRATDQVMIESKFVEVSDSDVKNLGVNWSSLANYQISAGGLGGDFTRNRTQTGGSTTQADNSRQGTNRQDNTSLSTNTQGSTASNLNEVSSINGTPRTESTTISGGTQESSIASGIDSLARTQATTALSVLSDLAGGEATSRTLNAVFSASDFSVVLSALQSLQSTKIVSNPTIVTLNNTQAVINVGEERPIPSYTYNAERGAYEVSGFTYRAIGVNLTVTPQVNSRGFIRLSVVPEVSQSTRDANFQGAAIPIVESRKASTQVSLKDGYTLGIGGLLQSEQRNGNTKVPLLGSMPVIGRLFRSEDRRSLTNNLIIFITAKTISADGAPIEQVFNSETVRGLQMRREDLPGHRDGTSPFLPPLPTAEEAAEAANQSPKRPFFRLTTPSANQ